jgi:hypothetical protein
MKLSEVKAVLPGLDNVAFELEGGAFVPEHFHVTEVGQVTRKFIDCGGTTREETAVNFQLWNADDFEHRLKPGKLLNIITLCEEKLGLTDGDVEVEYQGSTIGRYNLAFNGNHFILQPKTTACLAQDACGIPAPKQKLNLKELSNATTSCAPGSGCC